MTFEEFRKRVIEIGNLISEIEGFDSVIVIVVNNDLEKVVVGGYTEGEPRDARDLLSLALQAMADA